MDFLSNQNNRRKYIIIILVTVFSIFALWTRLIPMLNMGSTDILLMSGSDDPLYNLRQIEQIRVNFPAYNWHDFMSLYPSGSTIYWGPLFPTLIAALCVIFGASARPDIIGVSLLVPPIMAAALVPIMYFVGKSCGNYKTGLLAAAFTAVVTGQFFYRSFYGYLDHHIAEVFFSTLFCLFYIYAIHSVKKQKPDLKDLNYWKNALLFPFLAGIMYLLGLFTMPTMILFAMIVAIFTLVQFLINTYQDRSSEYLVVTNSIIFSIAIIGLLLFGIKHPGLELSRYTLGHIFAYLGLIGWTIFLYGLARYTNGKAKYLYPALLAAIGVLFAAVLNLFLPEIYNLLIGNLFSFFGQAAVTNTVQEARGWTADLAWNTFNYGLILFAGGTLVMIYNNIREEHPHHVFVIIWSVIVFASTWQHIRYEYYLAINIALMAAVCVQSVIDLGWKDLCRLFKPDSEGSGLIHQQSGLIKEPLRSKKQRKKERSNEGADPFRFVTTGLIIIIVICTVFFAYTSATYSIANASGNAIRMNGDWRAALDWMAVNTPEPGVDYYKIYDKDTFRYPPQSYGVMSWWDYGHMITYIGKRIPNANPFQQGVAGSTGSAAYFMAESEDIANNIADVNGLRYVITDIEMDEAINGKFWAMATWYNTSAGASPYMSTYGAPSKDIANQIVPVPMLTQHYYNTMVSRLHNFDGSLTQPTSVYYIEYVDPSISSVSIPVITFAEAMSAPDAEIKVRKYLANATQGHHAAIVNNALYLPVEKVPALGHYRLVYESPTNVYGTKKPDIKYVKVFEYVKGAHIRGEGIIEVPVTTNTGRSFVYRQESQGGEFIVPYSTTGTPYGMKTTGKYRIIGTSRQIDVPEDAVMKGLTVQ